MALVCAEPSTYLRPLVLTETLQSGYYHSHSRRLQEVKATQGISDEFGAEAWVSLTPNPPGHNAST